MSVLAIEQCLVSKLPSLFGPEMVDSLEVSDVARMAAESEESASERRRYKDKLAILEDGLRELMLLDRHSPSGPCKYASFSRIPKTGLTFHADEVLDADECEETDDVTLRSVSQPSHLEPSPPTVFMEKGEYTPGLVAAADGDSLWAAPSTTKKKKKKKRIIEEPELSTEVL